MEPIYFGQERWIFVPSPPYCLVYEKWQWPLTAALLEEWGLA